jgi:hypothetical protein
VFSAVMAHSPFRVVADDLVNCQAHGLRPL